MSHMKFIGPSLFKVYINNLPRIVRSRVCLFADNTIVYLTRKSHASAYMYIASMKSYTILKYGEKNGHWHLTLTSVKFSDYTHTHFITPSSEPQKNQNACVYLGALLIVTSIGHLSNTITNKARNSLRFIRQNVKTQKRLHTSNIYVCMTPGQILFNYMAPIAETPHTQNRNGSKVSYKVCPKLLSLYK